MKDHVLRFAFFCWLGGLLTYWVGEPIYQAFIQYFRAQEKIEELDMKLEQVQDKLDRKESHEPRQSTGGGTSIGESE